ncbi:MAG TPA: NlpC/P60 family protein [Gaiellaceae bacterium]|nr:NlpC/P60 family protein [Gaiellaceae bacterium]
MLADIQAIDSSLSKAVDAYNAAQIKLDAIRAEEKVNRRHLVIARGNFKNAQATLANRLLALYKSGDDNVLEVLLGSRSLGELLERVDTISRVSAEDARVVGEIRNYRAEIKRREKKLAAARAQQEQVLAERAERRRQIEGQLAERQRLLATIKDQIAKIKAQEAERQRRLQAQAQEVVDQQGSSNSSSGTTGSGAEPAADGASGSTPPPATYGGVVGIAMQYLGVPYVWGGASPSGFDCSGFIMYVYAKVGVSLPHNAAMQYGYGSPVSRDQLQAGDLVFFDGLGHNGLYIGGGSFIHSPHTGDVVKISSLSDSWYASTYVGARRL